jgi:restriction system protein
MTTPSFQTLMLPVMLSLSDQETAIGAVVERVADVLKLTAIDRAELLPSGKKTTLSNRVHWAKFHLGKAGLLESTRRGYVKLTALGQKTIDANPSNIDLKFLDQFEDHRRFRVKAAQSETDSDPSAANILSFSDQVQTPDELMRSAHRQIDASLAQDLLDRIRVAPPEFFEKLIVNLLLSMNYGGSATDAGRAIGRSGDDGVDGVIDQDALGLDRVYIQAKRYAKGNNIGSGAIRDFFGSLDRHKAAKGLFVTTSTFSHAARETADFLSKRIVLIDGDRLTRLMIMHNVGCRSEEILHIKKIDEEFFE